MIRTAVNTARAHAGYPRSRYFARWALLIAAGLLLPSCVRAGYGSSTNDRDGGGGSDAAASDADASGPAPDGRSAATDLTPSETSALFDGRSATDALPACPTGMASFVGFCIDRDQGPLDTWVDGKAWCTARAKRFCTETEWVRACNATGRGMQNTTDDWEWLADLASPTIAKKRGSSSCSATSSHSTTQGDYRVRCCKTR